MMPMSMVASLRSAARQLLVLLPILFRSFATGKPRCRKSSRSLVTHLRTSRSVNQAAGQHQERSVASVGGKQPEEVEDADVREKPVAIQLGQQRAAQR